MNTEHIRKAIKACKAFKENDMESGIAALETMTDEELHTFISFLETAMKEGDITDDDIGRSH